MTDKLTDEQLRRIASLSVTFQGLYIADMATELLALRAEVKREFERAQEWKMLAGRVEKERDALRTRVAQLEAAWELVQNAQDSLRIRGWGKEVDAVLALAQPAEGGLKL